MLGEVQHLLGVVAYQPACKGLFLLGHNDDKVGIDLICILERGDSQVFLGVDILGVMRDLILVEVLLHLLYIAVHETFYIL